MQPQDESDNQQNATAGDAKGRHQDTTKNQPGAGSKGKDPESLPDGSGTDAQGSGADHGQENGDGSFDAG